MDKNIIKKHLSKKFVTEAKGEQTPGITIANSVNKESGKINKQGVKDIDKGLSAYEGSLKKGMETTVPNKFNYNGKSEEEYHEMMEIENGPEMNQYDRPPNQVYKDRAKQALEGSSIMGNEGGKGIGNAEAIKGVSSDDFGKKKYASAKKSAELRSKQTPTTKMFGDDWEAIPDKSHKAYAFENKKHNLYDLVKESVESEPYGSEKEHAFYSQQNQDNEKYELQPIRNQANNYDEYTHFAIHKQSNSIVMPFDYSEMMPKKPVPTANTTPRAKAIYKQKLETYKREMKEAISELNQFKQDYFFDDIKYHVSDFSEEPFKNSDYTVVTRDGLTKRGIDLNNFMLFKGFNDSTPEINNESNANNNRTTDNQIENNNNKPQIKEGMKRLKFNNEFKGVGNALKLIPEAYKVDNKTFEMTDGVENYKIRWEGTLSEGRAVVLMASDKTMVNEDMAHMKHLMGYKSNETLGLVKGKARLDENKMFTDIWSKTRDLMEGTDIENQNVPEIKKSHWEDISLGKINTEFTDGTVVIYSSNDDGLYHADVRRNGKSVPNEDEYKQVIVNRRKLNEGTDIESAKAKTGNLEDIKKKAPEATKHVQGSVSKDKGTQAPAAKEGDLDDAVSQAPEAKKHVVGSVSTEKGTKAPAPKKGEWENVKKKASEATKHVKMNESFNDNEEEEEEEVDDVTTEEVEETKMVKTEGSNIEGIKASKTAPWEDHNVKHAAEAKKHVHMGKAGIDEGVTINGIYYAPMNENIDLQKGYGTVNTYKKKDENGKPRVTTQSPVYSEGMYEGEEFTPHGTYTLGNSGGYEIMLSDDGDAAKVRDAYGSDNPETTDWLPIEYVPNEDGEMDEEGYPEMEPVIDPNGYNIPLNMVMRINR